jgi:LysR family transcriptional regulator of gallate degradation
LAVTVLEGTFEALIPQLVLGRLDVVVSIMTGELVEPLVEHQILHLEQYFVLARPSHPLVGQSRVGLEQLLRFPWVAGLDRDLIADEVSASFEQHDLSPPRPQYRTDSLSFGVSLLVQSDALALLPREMVRRDLEAGQLVIIDVNADPWSRPTAVFFRRNSTRSPDAISFLKELRRVAESSV